MKETISFEHDKQFNNRMKHYLEKMKVDKKLIKLNEFGQEGVDALQAATPVQTGKTANSWYYEITEEDGQVSLIWYNTNINNGVNIALIIDSGHATVNGSWIQGYNYINAAILPVIIKINKYFKGGGNLDAKVNGR